MGPRFFNRGNSRRHARQHVAESASMGPRFFNRGNLVSLGAAVLDALRASMGPRFFNRGNVPFHRVRRLLVGRFNGAAVFQPRKSYEVFGEKSCGKWLQWGRGFSTAEIFYDFGAKRRHLSCFNGAAVFQPRKCGLLLPKEGREPWLQWGRGFSTAEIRDLPEEKYPSQAGFNGAAVFQPRKLLITSVPPVLLSVCFNGAAVFQPRK